MDITGTEGINVYADAKTEYTRQLTQFCVTSYLSYFLSLLEESKEVDKDSKKLLLNFQNALKSIPEWNHEKVQKETSKITKEINCDYFDDLLSAVFVAHTKVLSAIRLTTKQKKLQITIPKVEHFLHHTLIECARILWSNVYMFSPSGSPIERQKNLREIERLIQDGILQSIRSMLPVKNILKEYLKDDDDDVDDEKEEKEEKEEKDERDVKEEKDEGDVKEEKDERDVKEEKEEKDEGDVKEKKKVTTEKVKEEVITKKEVIAKKEVTTPVINIDTEPSVNFTNIDTVFDSNNLDKNELISMDEDDSESFIEVLDNEGETLDDFEEIVDEKETIDFETLE
jgi:hypothetical protein